MMRPAEKIELFLRGYGKGRADAKALAAGLVETLGLTPEFESYAMPDSSRKRWVTPWEEVPDAR